MPKFSKELKQRLIKYFWEKYGVEVSEEKSEQYLHAIANFYLTLVSDDETSE